MIELFTKCDPEYGRRVAEGIKNAGNVQKGPIGTKSSGDAVKEAQEKTIKADPY